MRIISPPFKTKREMCGPRMILSLYWHTDADRILTLECAIDVILWDSTDAHGRKMIFLGVMLSHLENDKYADADAMIADIHDYANDYEWGDQMMLSMV